MKTAIEWLGLLNGSENSLQAYDTIDQIRAEGAKKFRHDLANRVAEMSKIMTIEEYDVFADRVNILLNGKSPEKRTA